MAEKDFNKLMDLINNVKLELAKCGADVDELDDFEKYNDITKLPQVDYVLCFGQTNALARIYFTGSYSDFIDTSHDPEEDASHLGKGCLLAVEPERFTETNWMLNFEDYNSGNNLGNNNIDFTYEFCQAIAKLLDYLNSNFPFLPTYNNSEEDED